MGKEEVTKESENKIGGNWRVAKAKSISGSGRGVVWLNAGYSEVEYVKDKSGH